MFGPLPISPEELLSKLIPAVLKYVDNNKDQTGENTNWTLAVKESLKSILAECSRETRCFYTNAEPGMKEFMLDLLWWTNDGSDGALLACECEWFFAGRSNEDSYFNEVGEDFSKLLVFKAPLKLMIFATPPEIPAIEFSVIKEINRYLYAYKHHVAGETYLVLDFARVPKAWISKIEQDGASQPTLRQLPIQL